MTLLLFWHNERRIRKWNISITCGRDTRQSWINISFIREKHQQNGLAIFLKLFICLSLDPKSSKLAV